MAVSSTKSGRCNMLPPQVVARGGDFAQRSCQNFEAVSRTRPFDPWQWVRVRLLDRARRCRRKSGTLLSISDLVGTFTGRFAPGRGRALGSIGRGRSVGELLVV